MTVYATYFDREFLVRGLACLQSLVARSGDRASLLVLALDDECAAMLEHLAPKVGLGGRLETIRLQTIEGRFPQLVAAKENRSRVEYYFTLTPFLCAEAVRHAGAGEHAVYLDADLYFFAEPALALAAAGPAAIAIVGHRFPPALSHLADQYGAYNVGWLSFLPSKDTDRCLSRWQGQCLEWCRDTPELDRFGDQKYLDTWPDDYASLAIIDHPGVNLAPWNVGRHQLSCGSGGHVLVDGSELVFFHFHRLERLASSLYRVDLRRFGRFNEILSEHIYGPYIRTLGDLECLARQEVGWAPGSGSIRYAQPASVRLLQAASWTARVLRLFGRRRTVFRDGKLLSRWRSLRYMAL